MQKHDRKKLFQYFIPSASIRVVFGLPQHPQASCSFHPNLWTWIVQSGNDCYVENEIFRLNKRNFTINIDSITKCQRFQCFKLQSSNFPQCLQCIRPRHNAIVFQKLLKLFSSWRNNYTCLHVKQSKKKILLFK